LTNDVNRPVADVTKVSKGENNLSKVKFTEAGGFPEKTPRPKKLSADYKRRTKNKRGGDREKRRKRTSLVAGAGSRKRCWGSAGEGEKKKSYSGQEAAPGGEAARAKLLLTEGRELKGVSRLDRTRGKERI